MRGASNSLRPPLRRRSERAAAVRGALQLRVVERTLLQQAERAAAALRGCCGGTPVPMPSCCDIQPPLSFCLSFGS